MSIRLRELIRNVRQCKTQSDERSVIAKECALIRTAFKDEENQFRHRNVAKLLYIQMLGYPTAFGQMECLKLIASNSFPEKRIGYLGLMLLLDEKQEVLMLVTNSLKNDLNVKNQWVVGLALSAIGNIGSADIARDLAPEVIKLMRTGQAYIKKKAALCSIRILRKVPELAENFVEVMIGCLSERNHAVLLSVVSLMVEACMIAPSVVLPALKKRSIVTALVRTLKNLVLSGYQPEHDISGLTDPFLQVKILRLLRYLGKKDGDTSEQMNDILAQVATNTEVAKITGNAILYEAVLTIMNIEAESGLRVLAINILGRFLLNRDNNIRYVALNTLTHVIGADAQAVQRHRNTIVDCLKDPDISIRRRALDLVYLLINENNIKALVRELLNYLLVADVEFKPDLTAKICTVVEKYAPSKRWHVDTVVRVLSVAGNFVSESVSSNLIAVITNDMELQSYATHKLFRSLKTDISQATLALVGVWCIGEYGDTLLSPPQLGDDGSSGFSEEDVVDLVYRLIQKSQNGQIKQYCLNALIKLTGRFSQSIPRIKDILRSYNQAMDVEIQSRSCEYTNLFNIDKLRPAVVEHMPAMDLPQHFDEDEYSDEDTGPATNNTMELPTPSTTTNALPALSAPTGAAPQSGGGASLIDLLGDDFGSSAPTTTQTPPPAMDLMADLLGDMNAPAVSTPPPSANNPSALMDLLGNPALSSQPSTPQPPTQDPMSLLSGMGAAPASGGMGGGQPPAGVFVAYQKNGVSVYFRFVKENPQQPNITTINVTFSNTNSADIQNFVMQVAVPKYMKLQMNPPSSKIVPAMSNEQVTQVVRINNSMHGQKPLMLKLKIDYAGPAGPFSDMGDVTCPANV